MMVNRAGFISQVNYGDTTIKEWNGLAGNGHVSRKRSWSHEEKRGVSAFCHDDQICMQGSAMGPLGSCAVILRMRVFGTFQSMM
jgi:hypothetical protein